MDRKASIDAAPQDVTALSATADAGVSDSFQAAQASRSRSLIARLTKPLQSLSRGLALITGLGCAMLVATPAQAQIYGGSTSFQYQTSLSLPNTLAADMETFLNEFPKFASLDADASPQASIEERRALEAALHAQMAEVLNKVRAQPRQCGQRNFAAAGPVKPNATLMVAARSHNADMIRNGFFAHKGTDGSNGGSRIQRTGYKWKSWGENLASGFASVDRVVQGWLDSPSHCANLMNPTFREFGIHKAVGFDRDDYWTLNFATPI